MPTGAQPSDPSLLHGGGYNQGRKNSQSLPLLYRLASQGGSRPGAAVRVRQFGRRWALAALTPNDPTFQPGFEDADTSVTAAIGLNGYYSNYSRSTVAKWGGPSRGRFAHEG